MGGEDGKMFDTDGWREITVRGIVVAAGSSADDDRVLLETSDETEVLVDPDGVGGELREYLHEEVEARGVLRKDRTGRLVLRVRGFEVCEWVEEVAQDEWVK